jgi:hypothetical protein
MSANVRSLFNCRHPIGIRCGSLVGSSVGCVKILNCVTLVMTAANYGSLSDPTDIPGLGFVEEAPCR